MFRPVPTTLLLLALTTQVAAQQTRDLGAHVHGEGSLDIAVHEGRIQMLLTVAGADIVGFEHAAETLEERQAIESAIALLETPQELFAFSPDAGCTPGFSQVVLRAEGDHSTFEGAYSFDCESVSGVETITLPFFTHFAGSHALHVQLVTEDGATAFEVEAASARIDLPR